MKNSCLDDLRLRKTARSGLVIRAQFLRHRLPRLGGAACMAALALGLIGPGLARGQGDAPQAIAADEISDWNKIMFQAAQTAGTPPFVMTRVAAIVQVAVFDAVNGIERRYTPVHVEPAAAPGASQRAAAVLAAYTTLVNLYSTQKPMFDLQLGSSLASISSGAAAEHSVSISRGMEWGQTVAMPYWPGGVRMDSILLPRRFSGAEPSASGVLLRRDSSPAPATVRVHDSVGDSIAVPIPARRTSGTYQRPVYSGFRRSQIGRQHWQRTPHGRPDPFSSVLAIDYAELYL